MNNLVPIHRGYLIKAKNQTLACAPVGARIDYQWLSKKGTPLLQAVKDLSVQAEDHVFGASQFFAVGQDMRVDQLDGVTNIPIRRVIPVLKTVSL